MLSCRGKFKLFQGIQWINSIKVNSSSSSLLRLDQTSPYRGVFAMRDPWLDIIPCQRCHLWQLPPPGVMAVVVKIWYFLNSLLQSLSLSSLSRPELSSHDVTRKMRSGGAGDGGKTRRVCPAEGVNVRRAGEPGRQKWQQPLLPSVASNIKILHRWENTR